MSFRHSEFGTQEISLPEKDTDRQALGARSCSAAVRSLSAVVTQLHAHMQSSQQQQRLPAVYTPIESDLGRAADYMEAKATASQSPPAGDRSDKDPSRTITGFVKAIRSSFRKREIKSNGAMPAAQEPSNPYLDGDLTPQKEGSKKAGPNAGNRPASVMVEGSVGLKEAAIRAGMRELRATSRGQQCLLKALLQQEGLRVLEHCIDACLALPDPER